MSLVVISTHPIQYQAPVYRMLQQNFRIPTTVIYGSDFSVRGYHDREFGQSFAWDTDLLAGYDSVFLSRVAAGGADSVQTVSAQGLVERLYTLSPRAIMLLGYRPRFDLRAFGIAWRSGYPLLFRAETTDHARQRSPIKSLLRDTFLRWFYGRFDKLLYIGQNSLKHYQRLGGKAEQLVFSPYCVDTSNFQLSEASHHELRAKTREALQIAAEKIVLLFSGKLVQRKGPDLLIEAIRGLALPLREKMTLLFLGDGELRPLLEQLAIETPRVDVRFVGFQNQSALSCYYHAVEMLVMPSLINETWGLVVNEALHHGLPCIVSSNVGCAPDLVKEGISGEVFEAGSVDALTATIERALKLLEQPDIRANCQYIVNKYTVEAAASGIAQAYEAALFSPKVKR